MTPTSPDERRRHRRAYLPVAASVFTDDGKVGDYLVRNLSAGGALLSHGPPLPVAVSLRAILIGRDVEGLSIRCIARRSESSKGVPTSMAVEFLAVLPEVEDLLQDLVLRALDRVSESAVLVAHPSPLVLASLAGDLVDLGRRVVLATTPLETVRWLCDIDTSIDTVLVDQSQDPRFGEAVLKLVQDDFPSIRRVALRDGEPMDVLSERRASLEPSDVLDLPWTPSSLEATLERYSERSATRSSPPDPF